MLILYRNFRLLKWFFNFIKNYFEFICSNELIPMNFFSTFFHFQYFLWMFFFLQVLIEKFTKRPKYLSDWEKFKLICKMIICVWIFFSAIFFQNLNIYLIKRKIKKKFYSNSKQTNKPVPTYMFVFEFK